MKNLMRHMPRIFKTLPRTVCLMTSFSLSICFAQDVTPQLEVQGTLGKKIYTNVKIMSVTPQGVKIAHDDGISVIPVGYLPKEWLDKNAPGASSMPAAAATETPPSRQTPALPRNFPTSGGPPPEAKQAVLKSFEPNSLVLIKTDKGSGSGFIARADGATYIYTNAHVICGTAGAFSSKIVSIKTATGIDIPIPRELELSDMKSSSTENGLEDLARIPVTVEGNQAVYEISGLNTDFTISDKVVAYGNSLGGEVFTSLEGIIVGLGSDRIEISCDIVPGNSGGPVVMEQTKKVVGLSSYLIGGKRNIWISGTRFEQVRRFALRPDKVTKWRKMLFTSLATSMSELIAFDRDTLSLAAASYLTPKSNNAGFDLRLNTLGDYEIQKVLMEGSKYSLGQTITSGLTRVNQRLSVGMGGSGARMAAQGVAGYFADFYKTVAAASTTQVQSLQNSDRAAYLKKIIPELISDRQDAQRNFMQQAPRF